MPSKLDFKTKTFALKGIDIFPVAPVGETKDTFNALLPETTLS